MKNKHTLKVAIISSLYGGLGHYCAHLADRLSNHCELKFITYPQIDLSGTIVNQIMDSLVKERIKRPRFDLNEKDPFTIVDVNAYLKKRRFKVINLHISTTVREKIVYFTSFLLYAKKLYRPKIVFTLHDVLPFEPNKKLMKLLSMFYSLADFFIVGNEDESAKLQKYFMIPSTKIKIVYHGIYNLFDKKRFNQQTARHYLQLPQDKKIVLFFGCLKESKGFDDLILAINKLKQFEPQTIVFVASTLKYAPAGLANKYLRQINKFQLKDKFNLNLNFIESRDVEPIF